MIELGTKYKCVECDARFYDLGKPEPVCPKCGTNQREFLEQQKANEAREASRQAALRAEEESADEDEDEEEEEIVVDEDDDVLPEEEEEVLDDDDDDE